MKLVSWNVNGIRAVAKKGFLEWVNEAQPDILCVQETKAWQEQVPEEVVYIPGYTSYWHSAQKKGYSSVATYCKQEPLKVQKGIGIERFDSEGRILMTEFEHFKLYNIYFPNGQRDHGRVPYKMDFYKELLELLDADVKAGKNVVVGGDWNTAHTEIDLKNPKTNKKTTGFLPEERAMLDVYIEHGYRDTFREIYPDARDCYTWWSYRANARARNIGWRIDYFFVNEAFMSSVAGAEIHDEVMGSDHCPISLTLKPFS